VSPFFFDTSILHPFPYIVKQKEKTVATATAFTFFASICQFVMEQVFQTIECRYFISPFSNQGDFLSLTDAHGKKSEQTLCIDFAITLFYPNGTLERASLLDEERCRARMETNAIGYLYNACSHI
jgi:hypothetical protein